MDTLNLFTLEGRVAVVNGATRGLGGPRPDVAPLVPSLVLVMGAVT
jgi:hypothetical protein